MTSIINADLRTYRSRIIVILTVLFGIAGALQPILIYMAFGERFWSSPDALQTAAMSAVFFASFPIVLFLIQHLMNRAFGAAAAPVSISGWWRYICETDKPVSASVLRMIFSVSLLWVALKYIHLISVDAYLLDPTFPNETLYNPKLIDRVLNVEWFSAPVLFAVAIIAATLSFLGLATKPAFVVLYLTTLAANSWYETPTKGFSHGEIPILMGAFPLLFANLRGRYALDNRFMQERPAPYLPIYFAQVFVALFFVGAFHAKMFYGGIQWVTSDHLANSLSVAWWKARGSSVEPFYIDYFRSPGILNFLAAYGHLLLQLLPILALLNVSRPKHKAVEAFFYAVGAVLLWAMMGFIWPWYWWLGMALVFIDFDWIAGAPNRVLDRAAGLFSPSAAFGIVPLALLVYVIGFTTQWPARKFDFYPFLDTLSFYALPYDAFPYTGDRTVLLDRQNLLRGDFRCAQTSTCIPDHTLQIEPNSTQKIVLALPNASADVQQTFLDWCAARPGTFCGVTAAAEEAHWIGAWKGTYRFQPHHEVSGGFELIAGGVTAVRSPTGEFYSVSHRSDGDTLEVHIATPDGEELSIVDVTTIAQDRRSVIPLPSAEIDGNSVRVSNFRDLGICALRVTAEVAGGIPLPFYVSGLCSWRRV